MFRYLKVVSVESKSNASFNAPTVSGYTFVCWIDCVSVGWVGGLYIQDPEKPSTRSWVVSDPYSSGGGAVKCFALYRAA